MASNALFGPWLKQRRKLLDLTQETLARQAGCAAITLRKIEADEIRPSKQLAEKLFESLDIPLQERTIFLLMARGLAMPGPATFETSPGQSPSQYSHNLLVPATPLVGRE